MLHNDNEEDLHEGITEKKTNVDTVCTVFHIGSSDRILFFSVLWNKALSSPTWLSALQRSYVFSAEGPFIHTCIPAVLHLTLHPLLSPSLLHTCTLTRAHTHTLGRLYQSHSISNLKTTAKFTVFPSALPILSWETGAPDARCTSFCLLFKSPNRINWVWKVSGYTPLFLIALVPMRKLVKLSRTFYILSKHCHFFTFFKPIPISDGL